MNITAYICTRGRYDTTLPLAILSTINQTKRPTEFILWDDNPEPTDLRKMLPYANLFNLMAHLGIEWKVMFGGGKGQVHGHQWVNKNAKGDWCWRVDDDSVPEANCLDDLTALPMDDIGAIGGLIHNPAMCPIKGPLADGSIKRIKGWMAPQVFRHVEMIRYQVEHLHCSFLYRARTVDYPTELSVVGHREETIFTHSMHRAGYKVMVDPHAVTYHLRQDTGGIRHQKDGQLWALDEEIFQRYLKQWNVTLESYLLLVDMNGLGDAWILRRLVPEILKKHGYPKAIVATMHPDVWEDVPDVTPVDPQSASMVHGDIQRLNPYSTMSQDPTLKLEDAYRRIYGL